MDSSHDHDRHGNDNHPASVPRDSCFLLVLAFAALDGARAGLGIAPSIVNVLITTFMAIALVLQCALDAKCRRRPLPSSSLWLFLWLFPVAVPGYWIYTRRTAGIWLILGCIIAIIFVTTVSSFAAQILAPSLRAILQHI